jgi:transporter family protein
VTAWFWYAVIAAVLYGAHQIFTKLAADRIGEGLGGFVVEATAALSILVYLAFLGWRVGGISNPVSRGFSIPF